MNPEGVSEEDIYWHASSLQSDAERQAYLDVACGQNKAMRTELEELLRCSEAAQRFADEFFPPVRAPVSESLGGWIDSYRLLQEIGHGGMGVVYMAQQTSPLNRLVALKIIKPGLGTSEAIARFESEREALAIMDHPNIAKVLDAGTTVDGLPYFVMELIRGTPLIQFCNEQRLKTRERLKLFVDVCRGVQHAHQKGILHRDLKPSNILVAMHDHVPVPKIIDFGVAKAMHGPLSQKTLFTCHGQVMGTLEYMSPEQFQFNQLDIDTRSDVYSLGVLLYELLTGEPHARQRFQQAAIDEVSRMVREEEPLLPSLKLSSSAARATIALNQQSDPLRLVSFLRGELDWVTAKALEKERERRYPSAVALAEELDRFLNGEMVLAGPPGAWYRFTKLWRRHRVALMTIVGVLSALVLGTTVSLVYALRAERSRRETEEARLLAESRLIELHTKQQALEISNQEAQANFKLARQAVQEWIARVAQVRLRSQPEMADLRRDLLEKAEEYYSELLTRPNADPSLLIERATVRRELQRTDEDLADLLKLLEQQPDNFELRLHLAHVYRVAGEHQLAIHHAERATKLAPLNPIGWYQLGWCFAASGARRMAIDAMRRSEELSKDPSGRAFASACVLEFERLYEQAAKRFQEAAQLMGPVAYEARLREGRCWLECNQLENSLVALNECVEQNAYSAIAWGLRGQVHHRMGSKEQASHDWNRALSLNPNHSTALTHLFGYHFAERNHTEAAQLLRLRTGNENADLELLLSNSKKAIEGSDNPLLIEEWEFLVERVMLSFPIALQPSRYCEASRLHQDPQRVAEILEDRIPTVGEELESKLRWARCEALVRAKSWESAIKEAEWVLEREPSESRINSAAWLFALPQDSPFYDRALMLALRAVEAAPEPRHFNTLALAQIRSQEYEDAFLTLEKSIQHSHADSVSHAWDHLVKALALSKIGREGEVIEVLTIAKKSVGPEMQKQTDWERLVDEIAKGIPTKQVK